MVMAEGRKGTESVEIFWPESKTATPSRRSRPKAAGPPGHRLAAVLTHQTRRQDVPRLEHVIGYKDGTCVLLARYSIDCCRESSEEQTVPPVMQYPMKPMDSI